MFRVLIFQDKLGITPAYEYRWTLMLQGAGLRTPDIRFFKTKSYNSFSQSQLLVWKGNRKTPGFNEDPAMQIKLLRWMWDQIQLQKANVVIIMDPALMFVVNNDWSQATTELLRGGVYEMKDKADGYPIPTFIMAAISSINKGMKPKDIAALNDGFAEKDEWDAIYGDEARIKTIRGSSGLEFESEDDDTSEGDADDDSDDDSGEDRIMQWHSPIIIPYGEFCFKQDLHKIGRVLRGIQKKVKSA